MTKNFPNCQFRDFRGCAFLELCQRQLAQLQMFPFLSDCRKTGSPVRIRSCLERCLISSRDRRNRTPEPEPSSVLLPVSPSPPQPCAELSTIALEANKEHQLATDSAWQAIKHAVRCGELLAQAKAELPHGSFLPWLQGNFKASVRKAQIYMQLAANAQRVAHLNCDSIRAALAILGDKIDEIEPEPPSPVPMIPFEPSGGQKEEAVITPERGEEATSEQTLYLPIDGNTFRPFNEVVSNPTLRVQALRIALGELAEWVTHYRSLPELKVFCRMADKLCRRYKTTEQMTQGVNSQQRQLKRRARDIVRKALRAGKLARERCEVCGEDVKVQAHHSDYTRALDVQWLCRKHHTLAHEIARGDEQPSELDFANLPW
jgi:hypothetical protein